MKLVGCRTTCTFAPVAFPANGKKDNGCRGRYQQQVSDTTDAAGRPPGFPKALTKLLADIPNLYIVFDAVMAEPGCQPGGANAFSARHKNRNLFGKGTWVP